MMAATSNVNNINSNNINGNNINGGDGHAAGRDGPDAPVMRMKKRRWPSADRRRRSAHVGRQSTGRPAGRQGRDDAGALDQGVDFPAIGAVIPPASRRGRGSS